MINYTILRACPSCQQNKITPFYEARQVPVHSVQLVNDLQEAISFPKRDIVLGFCSHCGFISNLVFDPSVHDYSANYEASQGYSGTFNAFQSRVAAALVDRYDLYNKRIIEIGCGQGEFLALLCEMGGNKGIGFDPAYLLERSLVGEQSDITFIADYYSEKYTHYQADFICCKMTLEHIHQTAEFMQTVRRSIGEQTDTVVFFQVPNARYVFGDIAFWDIYYEHCSYFSLGSIARLFRRAEFDVLDLWTGYDNQYLMIEAKPRSGSAAAPLPAENDLAQLSEDIGRFTSVYPVKVEAWKEKVKCLRDAGKKVVLWGGGSKGVAFLTTLSISRAEIEYAVDINPFKANTYMVGTGQKIIQPDFMKEYHPDVVIVMNPIYCNEIENHLAQMGLSPELLTVHRY